MNANPHAVAPEEVMALLDGELSADRAQAVAAHTESCPECQQMAASLLRTTRALAGWTVGPVPRGIDDRILSESVKASTAFAVSGGPRLITLPAWTQRRWVLGVGAFAGAFVFLLVVSTPRLRMAALSVDASKPWPIDTARVDRYASRPNTGSNGQVDADKSLVARASRPMAQPTVVPSDGKLREFGKLELHQKLEPAQSSQTAPMIARSVALSVVVKEFATARNSLDAILLRHNGYAANLSVSSPQEAARSLQASLRIPAPQLATALNELKALGRVETETQNGEEVTQQHADLVARLKNSRETEQRLQAILTQRTGKISDVLEVEQEIARVRGEIEQMEAEQKNLEHRVDFATIDLKISEEYKAQISPPAPAVSTQIHNALVSGYRNVADTLLSLTLFFAEYGPVLLLWLTILFLPAWWIWRRHRHAAAMV
jgi:hypothetical protein